MVVNLYETKTNNITRKYFHSGEHLVPFTVPVNEAGRLYQFIGGAKIERDFETAQEEDNLIIKSYKRIYVNPGNLSTVNFRKVSRPDVSLGDYLIVQDLNEDGTPTMQKNSSFPIDPHPLKGKVTKIIQIEALEKIALGVR